MTFVPMKMHSISAAIAFVLSYLTIASQVEIPSINCEAVLIVDLVFIVDLLTKPEGVDYRSSLVNKYITSTSKDSVD